MSATQAKDVQWNGDCAGCLFLTMQPSEAAREPHHTDDLFFPALLKYLRTSHATPCRGEYGQLDVHG
eukprot:6468671-Amphidinium_carterae.1